MLSSSKRRNSNMALMQKSGDTRALNPVGSGSNLHAPSPGSTSHKHEGLPHSGLGTATKLNNNFDIAPHSSAMKPHDSSQAEAEYGMHGFQS